MKNLEIIELENKIKAANEARDDFKKKFEQVKRDMIALKKNIDKDKNQTLEKQAEELEQLKNHIKNKQSQDEERKELQSLKSQIQMLQTKLNDQSKAFEPETINERQEEARQGTYNPFYSQNNHSNVFLDNYAK